MRWVHSASVIPDGASLRRASAGDMTVLPCELIVELAVSLVLPRVRGKAQGGVAVMLSWPGLRRRDRQQAGNAAAADIVDAREHHVVALDLHHDWRGQALAVEFAERHGK